MLDGRNSFDTLKQECQRFPLQLICFLNNTDDNKVICREFFNKKPSFFYFRCLNDWMWR
jgi:hypothetical protein